MAGTLTTTELVKTTGHFDAADETKIDALIPAAEQIVERYCKRIAVAGQSSFTSQAGTEYLDGSGTDELLLPRWPVTVISEVKYDRGGYYGQPTSGTPFGTDSVLTQGTDYYWPTTDRRRRLLVRAAGWHGLGSVKVTYTAGYSTIPGDLQIQVARLVGTLMQLCEERVLEPIRSESFVDTMYALASGHHALAGVFAGLDRYRDMSR